MEDLLQKAGSQAVTFAIRSGISIASGYAIKTLGRFMERIPEKERSTLKQTKAKLQGRITIITPAIDLIELISARGNTSLTSTLEITQELKAEINDFEKRINEIMEDMTAKDKKHGEQRAIQQVEEYIGDLLKRIEESIPLISLALTTSGANLSARLPDSVSPGRLLQASNHLTSGDSLFTQKPHRPQQIGPDFVLKLYSIFYGTARNPNASTSGDITWKEEHAKCTVRLWRVPPLDDDLVYEYQMTIDENLDDGRYHEEDEEPRHRTIDLLMFTRLFFTASGRLLEIEDAKTPVLVLKLNPLDDMDSKIEWLAFEEYPREENDYEQSEDSESENGSETEGSEDERRQERDFEQEQLTTQLGALTLESPHLEPPDNPASLSLLEYITRLAALQSNDQQSILTIKDERISLYLKDEAAAPSGPSQAVNNTLSNPATPSTLNSRHRRSPLRPRRSHSLYTSPATQEPQQQRRRRQQEPQTPSKPGVESIPTTSKSGKRKSSEKMSPVLTPWEKDRLRSHPLRQRLMAPSSDDVPETPSRVPHTSGSSIKPHKRNGL